MLRAVARLYNKVFHSEYIYYCLTSGDFSKIDFKDNIALSIGGDHYCYEGLEQLAFHNAEVKKKQGFSVLWGCSVEPKLITSKVLKDLKDYNAIFSRESITYEALKGYNLDNVYLMSTQ